MSFRSLWCGSGLAIGKCRFLKIVDTPAKVGLNIVQRLTYRVVERIFNHHALLGNVLQPILPRLSLALEHVDISLEWVVIPCSLHLLGSPVHA